MILYFRWFLLIMKLYFSARRQEGSNSFSMSFHVLPTDMDLNIHLTNSRYPAFMDLIRIKFMVSNGLWSHLRKHGFMPMLGGTYLRYRRDIGLFQRFDVKVELVYVSPRWCYLDYKFIRNGFVCCHALEKWGMAQRGHGMIDPRTYLPDVPAHLQANKPPVHIAKLMDAEDEFRVVVRHHKES